MSFASENKNEPPVVTLTLFGFKGRAAKAWAFGQMAFARAALGKTKGLRFWQLLGSGDGGGFSLKPDWGRYGLLQVWASDADAERFFAESRLIEKYHRHAYEIWTVKLMPVKSQGAWAGVNPFLPAADFDPEKPIAVLTRAAINLSKLQRFWSFVPGTSREIAEAEGLIASLGIGEAPFVKQATFSLWRSFEDVRRFAYKSPVHREVIKLTRGENWYKEELFARFQPLTATGEWNGRNPLKEVFDAE